jgi:outer membrane protein OmpA-like peptidoglycan-associated protein
MPATLSFEATLDATGKVAAKGSVPSADDAAAIAKAAPGSAADALVAVSGLPDGFTASATAGLTALATLTEGRLGFDGARWWLRGTAETSTIRDAATSAIAAVPGGADWSVAIDLLPPLDVCRERLASFVKKNAIQFTGRKPAVAKDFAAALDAVAADLAICPTANVHVQAHTDADGNADANLALSVARAETVIAALVQRGIDESRLYAEGFGETDPVASNDTKAGKAANRRITFEIDPQ